MRTNKRGTSTIEYGLIMSLVFLVIIAAVWMFADEVTNLWVIISNHMGG